MARTQPSVVWVRETLSADDPTIPVWTLEEPADHVEGIWQNRNSSEETVGKTVNELMCKVLRK